MGSLGAPWQPHFESIKVDVIKALGRGAFGEVSLVKASPVDADHPAAVFALKRTSLAKISEAGLEHAQSEAKLLQRLGEEHESILQCFDFRVVPGTNASLELLLEFAPLGDLSGRIKAHKDSEAGARGGLPELEVVSYGCDVAAGLAHIHSLNPKVLHRDVKPANVVLFPSADGATWDVGTPRAKLADFGIAKVLEADGSLAGANTIIGTPHYFSPEICRGERYDERSDAWALGCVIYEMVCLHRPFHQAESNIAVLALRVMEGRYDKEALVKQAGCYNGLLIFALTGLMTLDPQQRSRAAEVLQPLSKLREEFRGGAMEAAVPWWQMDAARLAGGGDSSSPSTEVTACGAVSPGADSWEGAQKVNLSEPATLNPLQEAVTALHRTSLPSPTWKRTSELLLAAEGPGWLTRESSSPPTMLNPPTLDPSQVPVPTLSRAQSGPPGATFTRDRQTLSPIPDSTFHLSSTCTLEGMRATGGLGVTQELPEEEEESPEARDVGGTARFSQESPDPLGVTSDLGETVRLEHPQGGGDETAAQGMAPSRIAWQGMTGMLEMMSEPPPADGLDQTLRSEASAASHFGQSPSQESPTLDAEFCWNEAATCPSAAPPQQDVPLGEGCDQTNWAEPRIFLRPLWRRAGTEPPPADAPVMFCFTRDEQNSQPQQHRQHSHAEYRSRTPDFAEMPECTEAEGPPQSFQPPGGPAHAAPPGTVGGGRVLTGRASVLDPAHGWLEVELTIENAAALYAHVRHADPQPQPQRHELGGIFELTAVS